MLIKYIKGIFLKNDDKQLTEVGKLNDRLKELFKLDENFVVTLNGKWGVGKTYFWNKFVEDNLSNKKTAYVSLFGKENLKDIEKKIIFDISSTDKTISSVKDKVKDFKTNLGFKDDDSSFGITGSILNIGLSLFEKKDFKDVIVCFDDFERMSDKIKLKDVLGLISELKEQKNCKIIMILNKNKLEEENLLDYKDKIIDYDLHYKPTVEESYSRISDKLKVFENYALEYLNNKGINNIRVIKRLINALNDFEFIEKELKGYADIESEIVYPIMQLAVINALYNNFDLKKLIEYTEKTRFKTMVNAENKFETNKDYEQMLFLLDVSNGYFFMDEILSNINYYIVNSIVDKLSLINIVNNKKKIKFREEISNKIKEIYNKSCFDVKYSNEKYVEDMFKLFQTDDNNLVEIAGYSAFILYIDEIIKIDKNNEEKYKKFAIERLKEHIDYIISTNEYQTYNIPEEIINFDSSLNDYIEEKEKKLAISKIRTVSDVIDLIKSPIKNSGWSDEPEILNSIDRSKYIEYIIESPEFFKEAMHFVKWTKSFTNGSSFDEIANKITDAFKELKKNKNYEFKINKVLAYLNINDDN